MKSEGAELRLTDTVALIDEQRCIGCTLCIQACPVDAIVGAPKLMHTVVTAWCTGCELCVPPCPVDCIEIRSIAPRNAMLRQAALTDAGRRHDAHNARLERVRQQNAAKAAAQREVRAAVRKRETIAQAIRRARERLGLPQK
jgi:electron transport complex protein RnfB